MKTERVNSFIISVCRIMKEVCMLDFKAGEPILKKSVYLADSSLVKIGFRSSITGELVLNINHETARVIVSKMIASSDGTIDELGQSAISELGNMIAGNAATIFSNKSNVIIYITPPLYYIGEQYKDEDKELLSIPFFSEIGDLSINIFIDV